MSALLAAILSEQDYDVLYRLWELAKSEEAEAAKNVNLAAARLEKMLQARESIQDASTRIGLEKLGLTVRWKRPGLQTADPFE